jgi:hypothetical protein
MELLKGLGRGVGTLLLVTSLLLAGCESDSDDDNGGGSAPTGVWQYTEMQGSTTVSQQTLQINSNGTWVNVMADYVDEECMSFNGSWTADEDSIHSTMGSQTWVMAYAHSGNTLTIIDPQGGPTAYTRINAMVSCDDYDFGGTGDLWSGTLSATVGGTAMTFSTFIYGGSDSGILAFWGNGGTRQLQFNVMGDQPGTYPLGTSNMAIYVPDTATPTVLFTTVMALAEGTLTLSTVTATHIAGTFSFTAMNVGTMQTVQVTNGVVDITRN